MNECWLKVLSAFHLRAECFHLQIKIKIAGNAIQPKVILHLPK
jgi:hypothetical protein